MVQEMGRSFTCPGQRSFMIKPIPAGLENISVLLVLVFCARVWSRHPPLFLLSLPMLKMELRIAFMIWISQPRINPSWNDWLPSEFINCNCASNNSSTWLIPCHVFLGIFLSFRLSFAVVSSLEQLPIHQSRLLVIHLSISFCCTNWINNPNILLSPPSVASFTSSSSRVGACTPRGLRGAASP